MVVGLGSVAAEEDIAIVVDDFDSDADASQRMAAIASTRAPEGIEDDFDARLGNGLEIDELSEASQESRPDVDLFEVGGGSGGSGG